MARKAAKILREAVDVIEQQDISRATEYILDEIALGQYSATQIAAAFMQMKLGDEIEDIKAEKFFFEKRDRKRGDGRNAGRQNGRGGRDRQAYGSRESRGGRDGRGGRESYGGSEKRSGREAFGGRDAHGNREAYGSSKGRQADGPGRGKSRDKKGAFSGKDSFDMSRQSKGLRIKTRKQG